MSFASNLTSALSLRATMRPAMSTACAWWTLMSRANPASGPSSAGAVMSPESPASLRVTTPTRSPTPSATSANMAPMASFQPVFIDVHSPDGVRRRCGLVVATRARGGRLRRLRTLLERRDERLQLRFIEGRQRQLLAPGARDHGRRERRAGGDEHLRVPVDEVLQDRHLVGRKFRVVRDPHSAALH